MFISTFELLLNAPQLPREIKGVPLEKLKDFESITRNALQGYFLTISNLENRTIDLKVIFTVVADKGKEFNESTSAAFFDSKGTNKMIELDQAGDDSHSISLMLSPRDSGLLLVQANPLLLLKNLDISEIEIRGYVEVNAMTSSEDKNQTTKVLLTPEHRGTFYQLDIPTIDGVVDRTQPVTLSGKQQLDQISYSLPTSTGGCLFEL